MQIDNTVFVRKLIEMIDTELIDPECYVEWSDAQIMKIDEPSDWLIKLSFSKDKNEITSSMYSYIRESFDRYDSSGESRVQDFCTIGDFRISCLFAKYLLGFISWSDFLRASGLYSDGSYSVSESCEFFYFMLNDYEAAVQRHEVELNQVLQIRSKYSVHIREVADLLIVFGMSLAIE